MRINDLIIFMDDLRNQGLSLAFAESMTAGLLVNKFSKVKGASEILKGSIVTYNPELKIRLLNVDPETISRFTPESQEVTTEMVKGLVKLISADIAVAVTGLASEGGSESLNKPVGSVFISVLYKNKLHEFKTVLKPDNKKEKVEKEEEIMNKTVDYIFEKIRGLHEKDKKN